MGELMWNNLHHIVVWILCAQNATVRFVNNSARAAGAAIYANDMSRCKWLGSIGPNDFNSFIFNTSSKYKSPFIME